jgi:dihydrofolate reductase
MIISLIAAVAKNNVIGVKGDLPWYLPKDLKFFATTTRGHHVIMGRKNYDSIPEKYRPLPHRPNIVVTRNPEFHDSNVDIFTSIQSAIDFAKSKNEKEVFIIGGGEIYNQTIQLADKLYLTHVDTEIDGDTHFPSFNQSEWTRELVLEQEQNNVHNHSFKTYIYNRID